MEIKRRSNEVGIVPNEADIRWLVVEVLAEQTDEWSPQRTKYVSLTTRPTSGDDEPLELPSVAI